MYSRYTNPTVRAFEELLAALEQGQAAVATASGISAVLALCLTHLKAGDHVLCSRDVFGATVGLFQNTLQKFGVEVGFVPLTDPDQWRRRPSRILECSSSKRHRIRSILWQMSLRWPGSVVISAQFWPSTIASAHLRCKRPRRWVLTS